ncbi:TetR family transcriptional regulator [Actinoplanes philippinensis]|uniref:DNA-binding transcriptional regulator, AcrR family n=2 Tax=Actinoplanes philippinensis TaxID=35752 RepID=A0A1I2I1T0_9ACTN|nr:TetR family transcriptional regulator [Actinoplanes philippinensis]SFF34481.1 DNA-binding transcriptional regulator, AcrR family [Actinoplanes philippinensis]
MFLDRGFDAVRVADVARACGVAEKTVFNHFRTKESLLVDRWEEQTRALCDGLADPDTAPVDAALAVLDGELAFLTSPASQRAGGFGVDELRRFSRLVASTPSLVAHNREALDRLTAAAAAALAGRTRSAPEDPEAWITAVALAGLWQVYTVSLHRHLDGDDPAAIGRAVTVDLRRAAGKLRGGI